MFDRLPPKMHAVARHLPEDFEATMGIGDFTKCFTEQDHRQGKQDEIMTRGVANRYRAFKIKSVHAEC
jgi:hypothetical protein